MSDNVQEAAKAMFYRHQRFATAAYSGEEFTPPLPWEELEEWAQEWWLDGARAMWAHWLGVKPAKVTDVPAAGAVGTAMEALLLTLGVRVAGVSEATYDALLRAQIAADDALRALGGKQKGADDE